jgi:hypothetical protein
LTRPFFDCVSGVLQESLHEQSQAMPVFFPLRREKPFFFFCVRKKPGRSCLNQVDKRGAAFNLATTRPAAPPLFLLPEYPLVALTIWFVDDDGKLTPQSLPALSWIDGNGRVHSTQQFDAIPIAPTPHSRDAIAALVLPDSWRGDVFINGVIAATELIPLQHTDCIEIDGSPLWIAADSVPEETQYSITRHDQEARCFITKARLKEGEPIVVCPGRPGKSCTIVFKRNAWQAALSSATKFRCPSCSFDPRMPVWRPTPPRPARSLDPILRMIRGEKMP